MPRRMAPHISGVHSAREAELQNNDLELGHVRDLPNNFTDISAGIVGELDTSRVGLRMSWLLWSLRPKRHWCIVIVWCGMSRSQGINFHAWEATRFSIMKCLPGTHWLLQTRLRNFIWLNSSFCSQSFRKTSLKFESGDQGPHGHTERLWRPCEGPLDPAPAWSHVAPWHSRSCNQAKGLSASPLLHQHFLPQLSLHLHHDHNRALSPWSALWTFDPLVKPSKLLSHVPSPHQPSSTFSASPSSARFFSRHVRSQHWSQGKPPCAWCQWWSVSVSLTDPSWLCQSSGGKFGNTSGEHCHGWHWRKPLKDHFSLQIEDGTKST